MILNIVKRGEEGDRILRTRCKEVNPNQILKREFQQLIDNMLETLHAAHGAGLAAPQIGESIRLIVVDVGDGPYVFINPVLIRKEGQEIDAEGCLSIPGIQADVPRYYKVVMRGLGRDGREIRVKGEGFFARAMQHELDHLNGVLFLDKAVRGSEYEVPIEPTEVEVIGRIPSTR